jgi:pyruvate dehydrogenase E2 component (dihydrolipoamide acetyltransferase)
LIYNSKYNHNKKGVGKMQQQMTQGDIIIRHFQMHKFRSEVISPTVNMTININADRMIEMKNMTNSINTHITHVTITHIIIKAVAETLIKYPILYSSFNGQEVIENPELAINIPVDIEKHVEYIVIHRPESKPLLDISAECIKELNMIRSGNGEFINCIKRMGTSSDTSFNNPIEFLRQHYGNFVISNFGSFNIDSGAGVLSQPMIGSLCVGAVKSAVHRESNEWVENMNLPLTLSFDHRALDGAYGGRFLNELKELLENPDSIATLNS